jgi:dihydrofolate synthase / folylpolyglutamate synthase
MVAGEAQTYLEGLGIDAMKKTAPSLHRIEAICAEMNHPEKALPAIHVTGTNGKTTTARIAASLLAATGLSVGAYTSPHLETMRERIALNGESISENDFEDLFSHLLPYLEHVESRLGEGLTYFEVLTAMFFLWGAESALDAAVIEVGLGGRWDATNVVDASVAVITNVGLDHIGLLGTTKEKIAAEKAGIVKDGAAVVTAEVGPEASPVIAREVEARKAILSLIGRDFEATENRLAVGGRYLSLRTSAGGFSPAIGSSRRSDDEQPAVGSPGRSDEYEDLFLPLHGSHQGVNAAVATESVVRFLPAQPLAHEVVAQGLATVTAPGRMETFRPAGEAGPTVVLDVAHNPDGMSALVNSVIEAFAFENAIVIVAILADKDFEGMLSELGRLPCRLIATRPSTVRSVDPKQLQEHAMKIGIDCEVIEDVRTAVTSALNQAGESELVCISGSHYLVGEARPLIASH